MCHNEGNNPKPPGHTWWAQPWSSCPCQCSPEAAQGEDQTSRQCKSWQHTALLGLACLGPDNPQGALQWGQAVSQWLGWWGHPCPVLWKPHGSSRTFFPWQLQFMGVCAHLPLTLRVCFQGVTSWNWKQFNYFPLTISGQFITAECFLLSDFAFLCWANAWNIIDSISKIIHRLRAVEALRIAIFISQRRQSGQVLTKNLRLQTFTFLTLFFLHSADPSTAGSLVLWGTNCVTQLLVWMSIF